MQKPALRQIDPAHQTGRQPETRIEQHAPVIGEALRPIGEMARRRQEHRSCRTIETREGGSQLIELGKLDAPAFDQVSMLYAPSADGQVSSRVFPLPHATADTLDVWDDARMAAREFWQPVEHPELPATMLFPGLFAKFASGSQAIHRRAPHIGEHNEEVFNEIGS